MTFTRKIAAFLVHGFTASGMLTGFMAILAIQTHDWSRAMLWLLAYLVIDGLDGSLARMAKVKEVLPNYSGKTIDDLSDYVNYVLIPVFFFYESQMVEGWIQIPCVFVMLITTAIYYGKEDVVSDDFYFLGFTGLWNLVVFFLFFVFQFPSWLNAVIIFILAILQFLPVKFVYPSRQHGLKGLTIMISVILVFSIIAILWVFPYRPNWLLVIPILALIYYCVLAIWATWFKETKF